MTIGDFEGRTVVVTGAHGALGSGLVTAFRDAGAAVIGLDRSEGAAESVHPSVRYRVVDLSDDIAVGRLFDDEPIPWAVVHTAGGFAGNAPLDELDPAVLVQQLTLNLVCSAIVTKHALRRFKAVGAGRLVHTSSRSAVVTEGAGFPYSVSKLGVLHLVRMAAAEVADTDITVNAVVPSIIDTPANRAAMPAADHDAWPQIADVARAYLFLAAPGSGLISGASIPV